MKTIVIWVLCFLYATFFLGSFPLPPVPGRPFSEENLGVSRFAAYDGISRTLSKWGNESSFILAVGLLLVIFAIWMLFRHSSTLYLKHGGFPIFSFLFILASAFIVADFSREVGVSSIESYASARSNWILHGKKLTYPKWPTEELKTALHTRVPADIASALDSVVGPEFGKIPPYDKVYEGCRPAYEAMIAEAGPVPAARAGESYSDSVLSTYGFACRLMEEVISRFGKADVRNPAECFYGPAVKIIHALDRQKLRCGVASLRGENDATVICKGFGDHFGTTSFSFCK